MREWYAYGSGGLGKTAAADGPVYYHGHGRETRALTGNPDWDEAGLFVSHDPEVAALYGDQVDRIQMAPGTKVKKHEGMLGFQGWIDAAQKAKAEGYDVAEFHRPHDFVGHIIFNRDKILSRKQATDHDESSWYHGSSATFGRFDLDHDRTYQYGPKHWNSHLGSHFTSEHHTAANLASENSVGTVPSAVYHCSLSATNPKHYPSEYDLDRAARNWAEDQGYEDHAPHRDAESWLRHHPQVKSIAHGFREHLQSRGHDGITYGNEYEGSHLHECAIAFSADDIDITHRHTSEDECDHDEMCPECHHHYETGTQGHCDHCGHPIGQEGEDENGWLHYAGALTRHESHLGALTRHFGSAEDIEEILGLIGGNRPAKAPEQTDEQKAAEEADHQRRVKKHEDWQAGRRGYSPGDDLSDWEGYPHAEWVPIQVAQRFREHTGDQHRHSERNVERIHQELKAGRGMTDPLMLLHHSEANRASLGEGNHRLRAAERAGWTHVPARVVRMYDSEAERGKGETIPRSWRGSHQGRTPEMCRPSDVLSKEVMGTPPHKSASLHALATYEQQDRDRNEHGECHYYPHVEHEHYDVGNGEIECPYSSSHTDWDREYDRLGDVHRGMQLTAPHPDFHALQPHEKARAILDSLTSHHQSEAELGSHWSASEQTAKGYADPGTIKARHGVVFHAARPKREHIQTDPEWLERRASFGMDHHDDAEVPIQPHAPIHLKGVSWLEDGEWRRHDFAVPMQHVATLRGEMLSPRTRARLRRAAG